MEQDQDGGPLSQHFVDDLLAIPGLLPHPAPSFIAQRFTRLFAIDVGDVLGHDHYVFVAPNGLAVLGLAPSHPLIAAHRQRCSQQQQQEQQQQQQEPIGAGVACLSASDQDTCSSTAAGLAATVIAEGDQEPMAKRARIVAGSCTEQLGQLHSVSFDIGKRSADTRMNGKKRHQGNLLDAHSVLAKLQLQPNSSLSVRAVAPGKLLEVNKRLVAQPQLLLDRDGWLAIVFPSIAQLKVLQEGLLSVPRYLQLRGLTEADLE
ncbi:hypothetical protein QJQ45_010355 [Haematococcus lacustris]|nr:hypothetical protein QJQ45_010355 [Haematococcus lacustris]